MTVRRQPNGQWLQGQSGNILGRPRAHKALVELCRRHADTAITQLVEILTKSASHRARVAAAQVILDRAYGKPLQPTAELLAEGRSLQISFVSDWREQRTPATLPEEATAATPEADTDG